MKFRLCRLSVHEVELDSLSPSTCSTRSTLSKVGDFCRPNVERPFDFVAMCTRPNPHGRLCRDMVDFVESRQIQPCRIRLCRHCVKVKVKVWTLAIAPRDQQRFTISEVTTDWHEPMVPQRIMWPSIARATGQLDPRCGCRPDAAC